LQKKFYKINTKKASGVVFQVPEALLFRGIWVAIDKELF